MKKLNYITSEIAITLSLLIFLSIILNPLKFNFTNIMYFVLGFIALIWFIIFTFFLLKENTSDERESLHVKLGGRLAFVSGAGLLMIGIMVQSLQGNLDIWLPGILAIMMITKTISIVYSRYKN